MLIEEEEDGASERSNGTVGSVAGNNQVITGCRPRRRRRRVCSEFRVRVPVT